MDDLKEVIRGNLQDADQRILDRLGHIAEATLRRIDLRGTWIFASGI